MAESNLQSLHQELEVHMNRIARCFKPHMRVTVVIRCPGSPEEELVVTRDDLDEVIETIKRRKPSVA